MSGPNQAATDLLIDLGRSAESSPLRDLLSVALADPSLRIGFWVASAEAYVDPAGRIVDPDTAGDDLVTTRIVSRGEPVAVFLSDASRAQSPVIVEAVLGAARVALENEQLHAELRAQLEEVRASRLRVVEAADAERRRIERNLHDGAQQRLVSLVMLLRLVRAEIGEDVAKESLDRIESEMRTAVAELRELARGIHPAILDSGLLEAIRSLADRATIPLRIVADDVPRGEPGVEAAAYYVCCEALTNAVRHGGASRVEVHLRGGPHELLLDVSDDGVGGADPSGGTGLHGLADRVAALGGMLTIDSPAGEGTALRVRLPLDGGGA